MMTIVPGTLVLSLAGRDKGRFAIVIGLPEENYALIADGKLHKVDSPKKKKLKHLKVVRIQAKFYDSKEIRLTNKRIRDLISYYESTDKENDL